MVIGTLQLELRFHKPRSLKEKRVLLKSLTARIRKQFNVSIAELDGMDVWQRSRVAIAAVGRGRSSVNRNLDYVLDFIHEERQIEITKQQMELL
ncbi:MAG: hypothetical protein A3G87_09960 [Omnitrophica bacterium RIFCSPLOWO2_12_FULL_50_11]|nr:MAG: hypothetical protein A3G87_09960 [Omnitrophica bacterium RIFCSPLOWO2_12_FULL_50_11]